MRNVASRRATWKLHPGRCPDVARRRAMTKKTLNDRMLKSLRPAPSGKRYERMDAVVPGFGVRVTESGQRTFILIARYPGSRNPTRREVGKYGELTLEAARTRARGWLDLLRKGVDPRIEE